jgi:hypothetical protein
VLATTVDHEAVVVLRSHIHDLAELGSGKMRIDAAVHKRATD